MNAIGIDLGATKIKGVAVTADGNTLLQTNLGFETGEKMVWADKIRGLVRQMQTEAGREKLATEAASRATGPAVGVSAPGLAAADRRSIFHMPSRLKGLEGLDWTELLALG